MSVSMQGTIEIDVAEWVEFLKKQAGMDFPAGVIFLFGPIVDNGDFLSVEFAMDDNVCPSDWEKPPTWLNKETSE